MRILILLLSMSAAWVGFEYGRKGPRAKLKPTFPTAFSMSLIMVPIAHGGLSLIGNLMPKDADIPKAARSLESLLPSASTAMAALIAGWSVGDIFKHWEERKDQS